MPLDDAASTARKRPNVLFLSVDQWPANLLQCAGHPTIETPTLDRLASIGTRFTRAYSECPICIPARRTMMTGASPRRHGDREFQPALPMPAGLPTLAEVFRANGYQATAIGKLHVYPPRDRIGFDDVMLAEEGRGHLGGPDDYEIFLADRGFAGQQFMHGMSNNEYSWRTWHLPEDTHVTNWITATAARSIKRRDPTRPALWQVSYTHPHPPLVPLASYFDRYRSRDIVLPSVGEWARLTEGWPVALRAIAASWQRLRPDQHADMLRAFYALCTHIDHQIRILIGTLREEDILDNTIILFASDHGDMLGTHGLYAKRVMYEGSCTVPMIVVDTASSNRPVGVTDDRLVGLQDIMPTLLEMCGLEIPGSCEGLPMSGEQRRENIYCEALSGAKAMRMVHDGRHKLIWYPAGNVFQLFDIVSDPTEGEDLSARPDKRDVLERLKARLQHELYGADTEFIRDGHLVGTPAVEIETKPNRGLSGQRGVHFPPIPPTDPTKVVGFG